MNATNPEPVTVHAAEGHVEVTGLSEQDVEDAISLYRAVPQEQLRAREALASHVNQVMLEQKIPLVPASSQRQVQRNAQLRQHLLEEQGAETYASLAGLRGMKESSVRTWVARARASRALFTVEVGGRTLIPTVQLSASGELDPVVTELTRPLLHAGLSGWALWAWLTSPTSRLSGGIPAEVARVDMPRAHRAALRYADELQLAAESSAGTSVTRDADGDRADTAR